MQEFRQIQDPATQGRRATAPNAVITSINIINPAAPISSIALDFIKPPLLRSKAKKNLFEK
jgi:hypothetical protein